MRTNTLRTAAGRALALTGVLAALAAAGPSRADEVVPPPAEDRIFAAEVQAGYQAWDDDDNRALLFPYDELSSGPAFSLDLLYLTPAFGTLDIEGSYVNDDTWLLDAEYHRGAKFDAHVLSQKSILTREPDDPLPSINVPNPVIDPTTGKPYDPIETEYHDAEPGADYAQTPQTNEFSLKVRAPGYPAHLRASGRIVDRGGTEQMAYSYRACSSHICHTDSRPREIDQRIEEFSIGADSHLGPVDLAYTHTRQTFRDRADNPVDYYADPKGNLMTYPPNNAAYPPGNYAHGVLPDIDSYANLVKLNTNLANRTVLALTWRGEHQENQDAGITRESQRAEAVASHTFSRELFGSVRLAWQDEDQTDLSDQARKLRTDNNKYHSGQTHKHVVEPDDTQRSAELLLRWDPLPQAQLKGLVRYADRERHALMRKVGTGFDDDSWDTTTTTARLDGKYRLATVTLDANLGQEWTDDPAYATENTRLTTFGAGATWVPSPLLSLQASYQGYRGENDDDTALSAAFEGPPPYPLDRSVDGNAWSLVAVVTPTESLTLTASWLLDDNGIEQDLTLGAVSPPGFSYYSPDTDWSGKTQTVSLRGSWAASKRLTITGEGTWISGHEYYDPTFPEGAGLEEIGEVEFTKVVASLGAELRLSERVGMTVSGSYADYNDQVDNANDGSALGALVAVNVRW